MTVADFQGLMRIRHATDADLPAILAIYNHEIATGTAIYIDEPQTLAQRAEWFAAKHAAGHPVFVLEDEAGVAGFASYGPFRNFPGYRFCVEHSLYVAENRRARGYGKQLLLILIEAATTNGMHTMVAAIDAANARSIALHAKHGFTQVALMPEVGRKFNRWLDLVLMQKTLEG
jgi:L-amino acid N-acyltransferase YncA